MSRSRLLLAALILLVLASVGATFYRTVVMEDFPVVEPEEEVVPEEAGAVTEPDLTEPAMPGDSEEEIQPL